MTNTVDQPDAEREPDNVTPEPGWTTTPAGYQVPADLDDDPRLWTGEPIPAPSAAAEQPPAPERRTVSLEVLTDELRADEDDRRREAAHEATKMRVDGEKPILLPAAARVGIVLRLDGEAVLVPETDGMWLASFRQPADVLEALLRQARNYADDHDDAELLMPTPDVLAALAGTADATFWTAPISVRAAQVQVGWLVVGFTREGADDLVTAVDDCTDDTCPWTGDCAPISVGTEPVHFATWQSVLVRIPAGPVTR